MITRRLRDGHSAVLCEDGTQWLHDDGRASTTLLWRPGAMPSRVQRRRMMPIGLISPDWCYWAGEAWSPLPDLDEVTFTSSVITVVEYRQHLLARLCLQMALPFTVLGSILGVLFFRAGDGDPSTSNTLGVVIGGLVGLVERHPTAFYALGALLVAGLAYQEQRRREGPKPPLGLPTHAPGPRPLT
jgi:hypothetical protein